MQPGISPALFLGALLTLGLILTAGSTPASAGSGDALSRTLKLPKASLLVTEHGRPVISRHPDRAMVPASTLKILTAFAAIERWGLDHRFHTDFYLGNDDRLWVKGYGDPYLVSEELDLIADALKARGVRKVAGIGTDDSYFDPNLAISGRSSSDNPYDAPVTGLAANFNTVNVINKGGKVRSAEAQTPLTPMARRFGQGLGAGTHRVNLEQREKAVRYFGELLSAKLEQAGVRVGSNLRNGPVPTRIKKVYRHQNSHDLRSVITAMLEYSNNFIANALFLKLADPGDGRALNMSKAQRAFARWVDQTFEWRDYRIEDGAGLSRGNRLSARQLLEVVNAFAPYRTLLPKQNAQVRAKTGTLRGVSSYAGFVKRNGRWEPFSLLINQPVPHNLRRQVANSLANTPDLTRLCPGGSC
ncbi:D-alanyl-D-alanine carboxypeptidase/D-alanyl-D-alanine-endopeptidase [Candidatus Thiosymbion oneisti]|uniref:D-alanyl-D-alanine carboxypeptidase/D-alanyl-D-alanine-endopeptidase n=1 Tax=Candidatus Thiosymbion oneisti TaxID=589554 RepID=UPI000A4A90E7|nr:D-alanyl-D-alanine carboxypeptidase [Candidatus Thiosymbion oneisti]